MECSSGTVSEWWFNAVWNCVLVRNCWISLEVQKKIMTNRSPLAVSSNDKHVWQLENCVCASRTAR